MRFCTLIIMGISALAIFPKRSAAQERLSLEEAMTMLYSQSKTIRIAEKGIDIAHAQKQMLNSAWYPYINAAGAYINLSEEIKVQESVANLAKPIAEQLSGTIPQLGPIISLLGSANLTFPLLDKNLATVDGSIMWPLFTGGKRIYANRVGKSLINSARLNRDMQQNIQITQLVEQYYTLKLISCNIDACRIEVQANGNLYRNALKLMENGIINRAEMLVAKMAFEEATLKLESTMRKQREAEKSLRSLLGIDTTSTNGIYTSLVLDSPFFICTQLPSEEEFLSMARTGNNQTKLIEQQRNIVENNKKIARSGYLPDISIFARQNLWSYNIPSNLLPRTTLGAAFIWNLFDGMNREKRIHIARLQQESLDLGKREAEEQVARAVRNLYSILEDAGESLESIGTSISLATELVKIREKSFKEGMATASEVVEANALLAKSNMAANLACFQYEMALANMTSLCGNGAQFVSFLKMDNNIYR